MRLFFSTTPRSKKYYSAEVQAIYDFLHSSKYTLTETAIEQASINEFYEMSPVQKQKFHDREIRELRAADIAVFEVSTPSIGLGHFVTKALEFGKPTILLHTKGNKPFVFYESEDQRVVIVEYTLKNLSETLRSALDYAQEQTLTRYHFVLDPQQEKYLKWIAEKKRVPRAVYLRELIQKDMEKGD